ncbi:MAG: 30S ribosomal protein S1 [Micavibrio aeruginosavorus]|uniref:30S ribosomal protein S1 n=1 Tax=Micavibrio aeruginosavorus TaxID=349221 RepID=A0A2W5A8V2_9BACT|nr:MAG: 30S ribosomal protein S1 [Micavibrio aeruginosavorus]
MAKAATKIADNSDSMDFAALLGETSQGKFEGSVVKGKIINITDDAVIIDVGLKSEGRVALREFSMPGQDPEIRIGDLVEVYVDRMENRDGETVLSREKARREEVWIELEKSSEKGERVTGVIFGRVKGGFTVDLGGAVAFLPGSQVDIRPVRDVGPLMGTPQPFLILKMDRQRGNIVVSRRAVLEESRDVARSDLLETIREGSVVQGLVKNITDYGAFIDLGGVDGLLHVTDISWKRVNHPSEVLSVGQTVDVQVIRYNADNGRISLGMKQLEKDPWESVAGKYPVGVKLKGRITNITDYGAFVELEDGIEGLVHVSEMSWTKKNVHPGKIVSTSQEVEVMVLEVDMDKRRISLGMKQTQENPWAGFGDKHKVGEELEGEIRNITEFGLFVGIDDDIDGMVHLSDISWEDQSEDVLKNYKKGDKVKVKILDIDPSKERVALGMKQLTNDPFEGAMKGMAKGAVVTCTVTEVNANGIEVTVGEGMTGTIKKADLSRERSEQRPDRFAVGEKVDAKILTVDKKKHQVTLSIKARELDEDKQALEQFGSTESGASLGDILGAALGKADAKAPAKKASKKKDDAAE